MRKKNTFDPSFERERLNEGAPRIYRESVIDPDPEVLNFKIE